MKLSVLSCFSSLSHSWKHCRGLGDKVSYDHLPNAALFSSATYFCEWCCDRKARAARQRKALWQQATMRVHPTRSLSSSPLACTIDCSLASQAFLEVSYQDHSIGITVWLLVRATYI